MIVIIDHCFKPEEVVNMSLLIKLKPITNGAPRTTLLGCLRAALNAALLCV